MQEKILSILRRNGGHATSAEIQAAAGVSQSTASRALAPMMAAGVLMPVGKARGQGYVLLRAVRGIDGAVPIFKVDEAGVIGRVGRLIPIAGSGYWLDAPTEWRGGAYASLPWFMRDMRPQGFLGRAFAKEHPELELAANPGHWSDDDVLRALCTAGDDLVGNLVIGATSLAKFQARAPVLSQRSDYPELAQRAMSGANPGSSAGGEQPKFCTYVDGAHVLVKFSAADESPAARRVRDLLVAEHLALRILADHGVEAAPSRLEVAGGRVFLESTRFDRRGAGRVGMVSLMCYDSEFVGQIDNWAKTAGRMRDRALLTRTDAETMQLLEAFGRLIGNTDRHYGNISLIRKDNRWRLAPVYDFLPMVYMPVNGEIVRRDFDASTLAPTEEVLDVWPRAQELAANYWAAVTEADLVSEEFRDIAAGHAQALGHARPAARPRQAG